MPGGEDPLGGQGQGPQFGWLTRRRRLCRDHERSTAHAEDFIKIAMIRLMATRPAGHQTRYRNIRPAVS